jgi:hypothetical protein
LPNNWDKLTYSEKGDGRQISFPVEMKPVIKWTRKHYILESGKLISGPRRPIEMIKIDFCTERLVLDLFCWREMFSHFSTENFIKNYNQQDIYECKSKF